MLPIMSMSRYQMVSKMFLLYYLTWFRGIAGIKFGITRVQRGDFFTNPYASSCRNSYVDDSFCRATNSSCYKNYPGRGNKCCYCRCDSDENTFDVRKLSCAKNDDIRKGKSTGYLLGIWS